MANPALNIALIAAAQQQAQTEQALLKQLKEAEALSPRRATKLDLSAKVTASASRLAPVLIRAMTTRRVTLRTCALKAACASPSSQ